MPRNSRLLFATYWLLNAVSALFLFIAAILAIGLVAYCIVAMSPHQLGFVRIPFLPPTPIDAQGSRIDPKPWGYVASFVWLALVGLALRAMCGIVRTARAGDPFVRANADRLATIGWLLLATTLFGPLTIAVTALTGRFRPQHMPDNFLLSIFSDASPVGLFTVLLVFTLAQIFRHGSEMRAELETTV